MALLLAAAVTMCAICIVVLQAHNRSLHHRVEAYKSLHTQGLKQTREWERKYYDAHTEVSDLTVKLQNTTEVLDSAEEGEALAPPSHGVPDIDMDALMAGSDDPVWDLVIDCRSVGVMNEWLNRHPEFAEAQPHRQYGEFATYILNLPESQRNVEGVRLAVTGNA